jgi:hypothetical protein
MTNVERDNFDLTKPFSLYSGNVSLMMHERVNLMEREVVKIYKRRLNEMDHEIN